jgi:hypothetical protein
MAALDFPNTPTDGQLFAAPNGITYQWNAAPGVWIVYSTGVANGWRILSRQTPSAVGFVELQAIPADVNELKVHFSLTPVTNDVDCYLQFYNASSVLLTSAYLFSLVSAWNSAALAAAPQQSSSSSSGVASAIVLSYSTAGSKVANNATVAGNAIQGDLAIPNIRDTTKVKVANFHAAYISGAPLSFYLNGGGMQNTAGAITGLRLSFSSGNIASGSFEVWGSP